MIRGYRPTLRTTEFGLLLAPSLLAIIGLIMIVLVPRREIDWSWGEIWVSLAFAGLVLGMSISFALCGGGTGSVGPGAGLPRDGADRWSHSTPSRSVSGRA